MGSSDPAQTACVRQPTRHELADLETSSGTGLAAAATTAMQAAAAATVQAATSTTVQAASSAAAMTAAAASTADNGRRTDLSHRLDDIAEFALPAMRFVVNNSSSNGERQYSFR